MQQNLKKNREAFHRWWGRMGAIGESSPVGISPAVARSSSIRWGGSSSLRTRRRRDREEAGRVPLPSRICRCATAMWVPSHLGPHDIDSTAESSMAEDLNLRKRRPPVTTHSSPRWSPSLAGTARLAPSAGERGHVGAIEISLTVCGTNVRFFTLASDGLAAAFL